MKGGKMELKKRKKALNKLNERLSFNPSTGCQEYTRYKNIRGYGRLRYKGKQKLAHRLMWELRNGEIPKGLCVLHKCDNPPCCNIYHLFLGTYRDNIRDCIKKRRFRGHLNSPFKKGNQYAKKR